MTYLLKVYCICILYGIQYRNSYFLGGGGCLLNIFSPGRGTYTKGGAYLKLGANSSIYGNLYSNI